MTAGVRTGASPLLRVLCGTAFALASGPAAAAPLDQPGDQAIATLGAVGSQVYECRAEDGKPAEWAFREPKAGLFANGLPIGRHFAGPTWEHADGSTVVGRVSESRKAPGAGDIPWLRLTVVSRTGEGVLTPATAVQRVGTKGGTLSGPCPTPGAVREVPYTADYVFLRQQRP